jgi:hypothetical protein
VGLPGRTTKHHEKAAAGEEHRGGALIWWKEWCDGALQRGGDLLAVGEVGRSKKGKKNSTR